jgi:hypothetical protein
LESVNEVQVDGVSPGTALPGSYSANESDHVSVDGDNAEAQPQGNRRTVRSREHGDDSEHRNYRNRELEVEDLAGDLVQERALVSEREPDEEGHHEQRTEPAPQLANDCENPVTSRHLRIH